MLDIYEYIAVELKEKEIAFNLLLGSIILIDNLTFSPKMFATIRCYDKSKREYRKIVYKNYIILYIVDDSKKEVIICHMFYSKRNYFNLI